MPRVSNFYGIAIYFYYRDHAPPHFHAIYAEYDAEINIETGEVMAGELPRRAQALVREWLAANREAIRRNWDLARLNQPLVEVPYLE